MHILLQIIHYTFSFVPPLNSGALVAHTDELGATPVPDLRGFWQLATLGFIWVQCSPTNVMSRHPVLLIWSLGLIFSKICTQVIIATFMVEKVVK